MPGNVENNGDGCGYAEGDLDCLGIVDSQICFRKVKTEESSKDAADVAQRAPEAFAGDDQDDGNERGDQQRRYEDINQAMPSEECAQGPHELPITATKA